MINHIISFFYSVIQGTPLTGHLMGAIYTIDGNKDEAAACYIRATRSLVVVLSQVTMGPERAIGTSIVYDVFITAFTGKKQGLV